jgi:hypothetical protein
MRKLSSVVPSCIPVGWVKEKTVIESVVVVPKSMLVTPVALKPDKLMNDSCSHDCGATTSLLKSSSQEAIVKVALANNGYIKYFFIDVLIFIIIGASC